MVDVTGFLCRRMAVFFEAGKRGLGNFCSMLPAGRLSALVAGVCFVAAAEDAAQGVPVMGYDIIRVYPHDPDAFTQGLIFHRGHLFEGTGRKGASSVRKIALESGEILLREDLPKRYFGEGIAIFDDDDLVCFIIIQVCYEYTLLEVTAFKGGWVDLSARRRRGFLFSRGQ